MKVHFDNKWAKLLLPKSYIGITLGQHVVFNRPAKYVNLSTLRHEYEHVLQFKKHGILKFLFMYLFDYCAAIMKYRSHWRAYYAIGLEQEARDSEKRIDEIPTEVFDEWNKKRLS